MKKLLIGAVVIAAGAAAAWQYLGQNQSKQALASNTASGTVAAAPEKTLRIALEGKYPPFEYIDANNQLTGFNVDLANALCAEMKVKCEFTRFDFDKLIPSLNENKADAVVASLSITEEREKLVQFTDVYTRVPGTYVASKKSKIIWPVITAERIRGETIGVVAKTTFDDYLSNEMDQSKVTIKRFNSADEMMTALEKDEVKLVFDDSAVLGHFLKSPANQDRFEMVGNRIDSPKWLGRGEAIALRKDDVELRNQFNTALQKLIQSGEHQQIGYKYFTLRVL
ncbi:transporter substrate-binding domain-containing protein [Chitinibacter sp. SCUT-21]|uniref:transporter substrate-binding domain-containing protein n=1 Tax=Chitinibacter sp. SCUT-21 TaxID=2970891 RepID=UPI0035A7052E